MFRPSIRYAVARLAAASSRVLLSRVFRRPAANFPGKIGLRIDPRLIARLSRKLPEGSVVVVGTNGKTTVTNLLADALEASGRAVCCNRTGANLDSGIASALLLGNGCDLGVLECDELWLALVVPDLKPRYIVLLNLFRDQLDRCGEIDRIIDRIVDALDSSPETTLIYNADDPLCRFIAERASNDSVSFGIQQDLEAVQNTIADSRFCPHCMSPLRYDVRQYGHLGTYRCDQCGFQRPKPDAVIGQVSLGEGDLSLRMTLPNISDPLRVQSGCSGHYMAYNIGAMAYAATLLGCDAESIGTAVSSFDPDNGRQQQLRIDSRDVLLNLAKNPAGFNQCIKLVSSANDPAAVAFFVNDNEADGHDVSWLWDVDFEELASIPGLQVFAGGIRGRDVQVRLKYAGCPAALVSSAEDVFASLHATLSGKRVFVVANYTSLPEVKSDLERLSASGLPQSSDSASPLRTACIPQAHDAPELQHSTPVVIAHMFPDLLNLYGDGGNVRVLEQRLRWRGIPVEIRSVLYGESIDLSEVDAVVMGGSPDKEQRIASSELFRMKDRIQAYVNEGGPLLAICGSYQILGKTWLVDGEEVPGLDIVDMRTGRGECSFNRLIDNVVLSTSLFDAPVIGYENHAGRTMLGSGVQPFGRLVSSTGHGNDDESAVDGVMSGNLIGTYLHGPVLSKNPELADHLLRAALDRNQKRTGCQHVELPSLDDSEERSARDFMVSRLGTRS